MPAVLPLYESLSTKPLGKRLFSFVFSQKAPYFSTVRPRFTELRPHYAELRIRDRRAVHNHIKTVHVIAICNGLEAAMGALAEATVAPGKRWIPQGMSLDYTAKATSDITCTAQTEPADWEGAEVPVTVTARRTDGTVVVHGTIRLYVSDKPSGSAASPHRPAEAQA